MLVLGILFVVVVVSTRSCNLFLTQNSVSIFINNVETVLNIIICQVRKEGCHKSLILSQIDHSILIAVYSFEQFDVDISGDFPIVGAFFDERREKTRPLIITFCVTKVAFTNTYPVFFAFVIQVRTNFLGCNFTPIFPVISAHVPLVVEVFSLIHAAQLRFLKRSIRKLDRSHGIGQCYLCRDYEYIKLCVLHNACTASKSLLQST
mmetsp:Transcript_32800/g.48929  ORF Transcript_32800/g.48929 Transcript_32800/m.48929 type:complete len:206 (-) Transcript_32800:61-678(-)